MDARLQPTEMHFGNNTGNCSAALPTDLLTLHYRYLLSGRRAIMGTWGARSSPLPAQPVPTQSHTYDAVDRLQTFAEGSIAQTYGYDARENRKTGFPVFLAHRALLPWAGNY